VQHVSSINVVELLKHDFVIMPKETVRWIEMVFGEGLSAEEASQKIAVELDEEATAPEEAEAAIGTTDEDAAEPDEEATAPEEAEAAIGTTDEDDTGDQEQVSETADDEEE